MIDTEHLEQLQDWSARLTKVVKLNRNDATQEVMKIANEIKQTYLNVLTNGE